MLRNLIREHNSKLPLLPPSLSTLNILDEIYDWEQRKLQDFSEKSTQKNIDNEYSTIFTNSAEYGVINQRDYFDKDIANLKNISDYYVVKKNYFVYNPRISNQAKFGPINRNKQEEIGVMSPLYLVFKVHDVYEPFLETLFKTTVWHKFMYQNGDSGARADRFAIKDSIFMSMPVSIPSLDEQQKVAILFNMLNQTITLHEEKQRQLERLKKALLQKMFADKTGYPALRFKGFTKKWEKRKLGEIADFNPKEDLPLTFEYVDLESVSGTTMIAHRTEQKSSAPSRAQRLARLGDLFYQNVRPYQKNNYLLDKNDHTYVFSTGYTQMRPIINGYFLLTLVQRQNFVDKVLIRCTGTSYPAINSKDLSRIKVLIPSTSVNFHSGILDKADMNRSDTNEAEKIGQFFQSLDKTITLHDKKIQYLKQLKRGLLQKIFI